MTQALGGPGRSARRGRTSLQARVDVALLAAGVAVVVALVVATLALLDVRQRQDAVVGTYFTAITETDRDYMRLLNAETTVRDFLLTGDERVLEPLDFLLERAAGADVERLLVEEFGPDSELVRSREVAAEAAAAWYGEWAAPAIEEVRAGGTDALDDSDVAAGRARFTAIDEPMQVHMALLHEGRTAAVAGLERATYLLVGAVVLLAALLVAGAVLLRVFLRRWVTGPLEHLAHDARAVAAGDREYAVGQTGFGEVHDVSVAVEEMRGQLVRVVREAQGARAELEESHERLREQAEDLARSNRDLEQFAYVASHDLQEPLRKVASFTQLLAKRYEGQLDERADQYIAFAVDGAKRMQRLINDLLGFSRVGRIGGEVSDVDMDALVRDVADDLSELLDAAGATVVTQDLPVVRGEEPLLRQLVLNLVGNAVKFRHPERSPEIRVSARRTGASWEFACADNGIGIDPQYADRVFVIFQRLHAKDVYEGTGIGLALCKKIVEYHGGDIWIDQDVAVGTTIRWTLPADAAEDEDPGSHEHGTAAHAGLPDDQEVTT